MKSVETIVREIVAESLGIDNDQISLVATMEDLGADSIDYVEILMRLEERFNIIIDEEQFTENDNVKSIVDLVSSKVNDNG